MTHFYDVTLQNSLDTLLSYQINEKSYPIRTNGRMDVQFIIIERLRIYVYNTYEINFIVALFFYLFFDSSKYSGI